jgi:hypothetical protein
MESTPPESAIVTAPSTLLRIKQALMVSIIDMVKGA